MWPDLILCEVFLKSLNQHIDPTVLQYKFLDILLLVCFKGKSKVFA